MADGPGGGDAPTTTSSGHPGGRAGHPAPSRFSFRGDVEGLRALAIGVVLADHAQLAPFTGGYIGVDVFFVISGFLITSLLLRELDTTGRISLRRFYARRVRRLLPSTVLVLAVVLLLGWLLVSPLERRTLAVEVAAAALYVVNWQQAAEAVDYSALGTAASPVQHFWSLAVEEQFYLVWPLALLLLAWPRRRRGGPVPRRRLAVALTALALVSFGYAVHLTLTEGAAAYFVTTARAWELAAGGLLALVPAHRWRWPSWLPGLVAAAGIAFIATAALRFDDQTPFPGPAALVPVLGAAAVIAAGAASPNTAVGRLLTWRPVRYVGRVSYAWYLWHWPAVVFATLWLDGLPPALLAVVVLLSLLPAVATHHLLEEPVRRSRALAPVRRSLPLGVACTVLPVTLSAVSWHAVPTVPLASPAQARGAEALSDDDVPQRTADALRPLPEHATEDRGKVHRDGCLADQRDTTSGSCVYGVPSSDVTVVLFGDSHAMQYSPALDHIARQRDWRLVVLTKSACSPARVTLYHDQFKRPYSECDTWREHALSRIADEQPALVLTGNRETARVADDGRRLGASESAAALKDGYVDTLRALRDTGARVITLADNPHPPEDIPSCVSQSLDRLDDCAFSRGEGLDRDRVNTRAAREVTDVGLIDPTPAMCRNDTCPAVVGNVLVYRNGAHMTATYMRTMRHWLADRLPDDI